MYFNEVPEQLQSIEFEPYDSATQNQCCSQGHRSSLILQTLEGGFICLVCVSNLISNPQSPRIHVSYALSQLSQAVSQTPFLRDLLTFHPHFLVSPLVEALSCFDDEPIACQVIHLVSELCNSGCDSVHAQFVARISSRFSSGALAWSCRQVYTKSEESITDVRQREKNTALLLRKIRSSAHELFAICHGFFCPCLYNSAFRSKLHCLGILLSNQKNNPWSHISDKDALIFNLVTGLQLPSDEIQGEILFVLYKISILQHANKDDDAADVLYSFCPKLLHLSLEALMKTQSDDVRLNCVALLTVLARRGFFENALANDISSKNFYEADNFRQTTKNVIDRPPLNILFAEAIKAPLLSSDSEVQVSTLDLVFLYLSWEGGAGIEVQVLLEENIADYVFEILRLSGCKDPVVTSCILVLDLLSIAEQAFRQRLAIGFSSLIPALRHVAEVPFHPVQAQTLKLIWNCISNCPGIVTISHIEELGLILTGMLKKYTNGEIGMLTETFSMACSIFVAIMKSPSSHGTSNFSTSVQDASRHAIFACLSNNRNCPSQVMDSLYLLKEAYAYSYNGQSSSSGTELRNCIVSICKTNLLPWFVTAINEMDEDIVLGVLETFHSILLQDSDIHTKEFANILVSSSWFSFTFGCLGLFPTEKMKLRVYLMFSSIIDVLQGNDFGQCIRDACLLLPSDPIDLLFLLGQKSSNNLELLSCQSAVLLILYTSSLYDDRLADEKLVLASLEQYILVNSSEFQHGTADSLPMEVLVNLYGLYRGLAKISYQISYSPEAERTLFQLMTEKEWDLLSARIHLTSLKWLFQQERICKPLSNQILKLCRCNSSYGNHIILHAKSSHNIDVRTIAELVASENNFAATILVYILQDLVEEHQEDDIIPVLSIVKTIIHIFPAASDQLCLHGIGRVIQSLLYHTIHSSPQIFKAICEFTFTILHSVHSKSLFEDEAWLGTTMKLMDNLVPTLTADAWTEESLLVIGILSLILLHSTNKALVETSKTILLSTPLICIVNNTIHAASSKGPALIDHDEGTKTGETLLFVLLLHFFSLRSAHAILPGTDWKKFLNQAKGVQELSFISIHCHDLCRLMHFGPDLVKLVASFCLLELFTRILDQKNEKSDDLHCTTSHLLSIIAVLEGLVFCSDIRVAMNCSLCLSLILGWKKFDTELQANRRNKWCRLIVEELAMSLAVPSLVSGSFMIHHKPAVHVAVSLLKLQKVPEWMSSVFDNSCIRGIIDNLSASNLSREVVLLFRELMNAGYLKGEQIASLNRLFQACRKGLYTNATRDERREKDIEEVAVPDDTRNARHFLIKILSCQTYLDMDSGGFPSTSNRLLEEIELFSKSLMEEDDS